MKNNTWARLSAVDEQENVGVGTIACRDRLGGILRFYHRTAA
jgi:hypothetical protein